jgi:heat shock protein HslJ
VQAAAGFRIPLWVAAAALCAGCTAINLAPGTLAGTNWRVATVNGKPTPTAGDYSMRFGFDGGFGARFGCNHMGGYYRLSGQTLVVDNLAQTLIGCPEPAASFENQGGAILGRPMRVRFSNGQQMGLSNEAGSIGLVPVP